jgi:hypothetical protein
MRTYAEQLNVAEELLAVLQKDHSIGLVFRGMIRQYFSDHERGDLISSQNFDLICTCSATWSDGNVQVLIKRDCPIHGGGLPRA